MNSPGPIILFGSGEISASGRKTWEWLFSQREERPQVAILETPAGFEPNSAQVAGDVADFLRHRLQNHDPQIEIIPARNHSAADDPALLAPLHHANTLFMGAGSPSYAVRHLRDTRAWTLLRAQQRRGAALVLASASTIAASRYALPVYEIYKVGEDLHWKDGLDFFADYGLSLVVVPHWNNRDGGDRLDTRRCYLGQGRFAQMQALLPAQAIIVGIDEHTALVVDVANAHCQVLGQGDTTILNNDRTRTYRSGQRFPITELGPFHLPADEARLPAGRWAQIDAQRNANPAAPQPPADVQALAAARSAARAQRNWQQADALRDAIEQQGWTVQDTADGPLLLPQAGG
ncbi:MAG: hypothetical protein KDD73_02795 [Anaerolineales bacterium]|nr:hypothetical protein [Anaerolineales bacterium]